MRPAWPDGQVAPEKPATVKRRLTSRAAPGVFGTTPSPPMTASWTIGREEDALRPRPLRKACAA